MYFYNLINHSTKTMQWAHYIGCKGTKIFTNVQIFIIFLDIFWEFCLHK